MRIALLLIAFALIAAVVTTPAHRAEGTILNVKVLVAAGITSNGDNADASSGALQLQEAIRAALGGGLVDPSNVMWVSYADSGASSFQEDYKAVDTCKGVDGLGANIDQALAADSSARFILIGHSLGGFGIARWASNTGSLSRIDKLITLDGPLDLGPTFDWPLDVFWQCSRRDGDQKSNPDNYNGVQWCGSIASISSDPRCTVFKQLTDDGTQTKIRELSTRIPFAAFDCTSKPGVTPLCLNTAEGDIKALALAVCPLLPTAVAKAACLIEAAVVSVKTDVSGTWRHLTFKDAPDGHDFWKQDNVQAKIADTARTRLIEVGETSVGPLCPTDWSANPSGAWIEGWACETKRTSSHTVDVPDAGSIAVVYSGKMSPAAILKYPSGITQSIVLNGESTCPRFEYHQAGFLGKTLCRKFLGTLTAAGPYTVEFKTTEKCILLACDTFALDGIETTPRQLSIATNAVDAMLIIDSSGSMSSNDAQNKRLDAGKAYLTASLAGDFVGVVDFDDSVRLAGSLQRLPDGKPNLVNSINSIDSSGGTNIGIGVQLACDTLIGSTSGSTKKAAILLTDGNGAFGTQDECFKSRGWPVFTFGFGSADDVLLQRIATNTSGQFARLPTSNIVCEFQRVRQLIAGSAPGDCTSKSVLPQATTSFTTIVGPQQAQATFSTSWLGSDVAMSLVSPSRRIIDRSTVAPDVVHDLGASFESYSIILPESGDWEVKLFGLSVPPSGEEVIFNVISIPQPADGTPPVTNIELNPATPGLGGTYGQSVEVKLSALDPDAGDSSLISGVSNVHYELDGGGAQTYGSQFTVTAAGQHTVRYWSVDSAGNTEPDNGAQFTISPATSSPTEAPRMLRTHTPVPPTAAPPSATAAVQATLAPPQPTATPVRAVLGVIRMPDTGSSSGGGLNIGAAVAVMAVAGAGLAGVGASVARRRRRTR